MPSMRIGSDMVILASRTPGIWVAACWAKRARSSDCGGIAPMIPITMKGAGSKPVCSSPSASTSAAPGVSVRTFLKSASSVSLDGVIRIDFCRIFGNLHRYIAGESAARQDHGIPPHARSAILGVLGGVVGKPGRGLDTLGLDSAGACRISREGALDLAIGIRGKLGDQDLDALIFGLESGEGFGGDEARQRRQSHADTLRKQRLGRECRPRREEEKYGSAYWSKTRHEEPIWVALRPFDGRPNIRKSSSPDV